MHTLPRAALIISLLTVTTAWADATPQTLPFSQDWSDAGMITANDNWDSVPGIIGYQGDGLTSATGVDPQTVVADGTTTVQVFANLTVVTSASGGLGEFTIANPVVGFQGSGTADAPFLLLHLDTRGVSNITVSYLLRDIDASADNALQQVALQFRIGSTGNFTNIPGGFVTDASSPNAATQTNAVSQVLPAAANNQALVEVRIITANAVSNDEWIGIDDLSVTGTVALSGVGASNPSSALAGATSLLTVTVTPGSPPASTGITVSADLTAIGGSATQSFVDDGTGGDVTSGDRIYSFNATITAGTSAGLKSLPVSISDAQARSASTTIAVTVLVPTNPAGFGLATPSSGGVSTTTVLTVTVTPGANPTSTALAVGVDLTALGTPSSQPLLDDGVSPDATAGDNIFTAQVTIGAAVSTGLKSLPVAIVDGQARTGTTSIAYTVLPPTNPSGVALATPASVDIGTQTLLTVTVTPGTVPASTGLGVTADLAGIGGAATQTLFDNATNGDVTAGDNIFSFLANVPLVTGPGVKTVNVTITDAQTRTGSTSTTITVRTPTNPVAVGAASPSSVVVGAQTRLTATVTPGTNPASTGLSAAIDLSSIGGSATQVLFDDGSNGDVTAGDGVFSFLASIPGATTPGNKSLAVAVADAQSRVGVTTIPLTVTLGAGPSGVGLANPSSVVPGAGTLLTVTVTPGVTPTSTSLTVSTDLTPIGGSATATFFDDGTNGDQTAADLVFTLQTTVAVGTSGGAKSLTATLGDAQSRTGSASISLSVLAPTNPTGVGLSTPATVQAGAQALFTVTVTPGTNPVSSAVTVRVDLTSLGGSATQAMVDDGTGGDVTAADNVFSFNATVPLATTLGAHTVPAAIGDAQSRTGSASIAFTVTAPPTNPAAVAAASPNTVPAGVVSLLTVTVTPGANPTSTALSVSADLTAIGGSSTQAFLDDGALGDVTAGDNVFTFRAVVASSTTTGAKSMPVSVADGQSRSASTTLALTVSAGSMSPVASGTATPASVLAGGTSLIAVTVTPGANPASTGLTASIDLRPVGGVVAQPLLDNGANGDVTAGDGIFSYRVTVTSTTTAGLKPLPVAVVDAQSRTAVTTVALTITPAPSNPSAVAAANPSTLVPGGTTLLTVTVTPGANPVSTGIVVTGNLTSIGGSATQAFRDDGAMGDVTAADNVFSFSAMLPAVVLPGTRLLTMSVTDAESRSTGASVMLIVGAPPATCGNSLVEGGEQCDDGNTGAGDCCSATCMFEASTTVCRAGAGSCDLAEHCSGTSGRCPGDVKASGVCRPASGVCDVAERCDGLSADCPVDGFSTQICRASASGCDADEVCNGLTGTCPDNSLAPDNQSCGESLVCKAGACVPVTTAGGGGAGCSCGVGSEGAALGLALLGLIIRGRRRR